MQHHLQEHLRHHHTVPAESSLGRWREEMLLVRADACIVRRLARIFRQCAIVVLRGRSVRLVLTTPVPR